MRRKTRIRRSCFAYLTRLCCIGCIALAVIGCEEPPTAKPVRMVRTMRLGDTAAFHGRVLPGRAEANEEVNLSFRVGGPLIELPAKVGDTVKKDQVLARIDPRDFEVRIRNYEGELAAQTAVRDQAIVEHKRLTKLFAQGAAAQLEVDRYKTLVDQALGRIANIEASLDAARDDLAYSQLKAPFTGVIAARYVENFQTIQPKEVVVRLIDTSRVKMTIDVPEQLVSNAPYVKDITCTFDAFPDRPLKATIHEISREASRITRTYPVTLIMDQPDDIQVLPGMTGVARGRAELPGDIDKQGMDVPASSVLENEQGSAFVWIVDETSNTVKKHAVETMDFTPTGMRVKGLKPGQLMVTAGVHYLKENQAVRIEPTKTTSQPDKAPATQDTPSSNPEVAS